MNTCKPQYCLLLASFLLVGFLPAEDAFTYNKEDLRYITGNPTLRWQVKEFFGRHIRSPWANGEYAQLNGAYLERLNRPGSFLPGARFSRADMRHANLSGSSLENARFVNTIITGANLRAISAANARFYRTRAAGTNFDNANLQDADFFDADVNNASFKGANLKWADFYKANLTDIHVDEKTDVTNACIAGPFVKAFEKCTGFDFADKTIEECKAHGSHYPARSRSE